MYLYAIFGIIVAYVVSAVLSITNITSKMGSVLYYTMPLIGFLLIYVIFIFIEKAVDFNFKEPYIGLILIVFLFLGFYLAFLIYYGQSAIFSSVTFAQVFSQIKINWIKYMTATPYIYFIIGSFFGWAAYAIDKNKN